MGFSDLNFPYFKAFFYFVITHQLFPTILRTKIIRNQSSRIAPRIIVQ